MTDNSKQTTAMIDNINDILLRHEKIRERIEVLSMVVGLGLTIFHSKN